MAAIGPATGHYGRDAISSAKKSSKNTKSERLIDDPFALGGHRATYDPVALAQRYSNDYQAEINRRTAIDPGDPTIAVLNDLRKQKIESQNTPSGVSSVGSYAGNSYSSGGSIGNTGAITASDYYKKALEEQQKAIQAQIDNAVSANNAYIPQINQQSDRSLQNAYIAREQARVNTPQALNAMGYSGGASESALLGLDTNYQNARTSIEQERTKALTGIADNEAQIRSTGDATLSSAAQQYYTNLVQAAQQAEAQAQSQANWEAEFAMKQQNYSDAAAQQAWQNQYDEKLYELQKSNANKTASSSGKSGGLTASQITSMWGNGLIDDDQANAMYSSIGIKIPTTTTQNVGLQQGSGSSGNYNTVWANVQRGLGGSNAGTQTAFNAVINYIQQSLRSGLITETEAQQMLGRLNL